MPPCLTPVPLCTRSCDQLDRETERRLLSQSTTLYVGNLSFYTTEAQMYERESPWSLTLLTRQCSQRAPVQKRVEVSSGESLASDITDSRIIMGLDRNNKTPCGFAFVEYYLHTEAVACMRYVSGTKLDERIIRCDLDPGYKEGRQFGRGKSGGQVRDEFRQEYDSGRGTFLLPWRPHYQREIGLTTRRLGSSASGGRTQTARAGSPAFTDAIRHVRFDGRRIGHGRSRCAAGRGSRNESKTGKERRGRG